MNIVCIGACYLDTILSVPHYPGEDDKLRATSLQVRRGGNCPNSLEVLAKLLQREGVEHVNPYLISILPSADAPATARIQESLGTRVDMSRCIYRTGCSEPGSSYVLRSQANGSRTVVNYNDLPEMTTDEFVEAVDGLNDNTWFHFEGRAPETTLQCIQWLRRSKPQARISVEIEKPGREGLEGLAAEADIVFYSRGWAESKLYRSAEECLRAQSGLTRKAAHLLCTWGSEGASCLSLPSGNTVSCRATEPGQKIRVVDTLGAGDTFIAGMLFALLCHDQDWSIDTKLTFAVQLATCKVQQEGFDDIWRRVQVSRCGAA
ncbi:Ribokinase-like protein [Xylariaceae sp. FL0016]|nr:Ribokinase-like protein [Xylariaceae sp. FL0016]